MFDYLILAVSFAFASVVQPGPFQAFLFSHSIENGWRKTIPLVFAPLLSDVPIILLVLFVLTKLPSDFLIVLQLAGGVFLLYLSYGTYKTWKTYNDRKEQNTSTPQSVIKAVLVNLFNPGPYLGWSLILGPILLKAWGENPLYGIIFILGFYITMVTCTVGMVVLFAMTRNFGTRLRRILIGLSAFIMLIFGAYQIWSGIIMYMN